MTTIRIQRAAGIVTLVPQDATGGQPSAPTRAGAQPTVLDDTPSLDVLVLEVTGGHLSWSLLAGQSLPAAVLDDPESAQDWLWAVYGEDVALAVADTALSDADTALHADAAPHVTSLAGADADADADRDGDAARHHTLSAAPARPELVNALRRLAYAHWAARWWPASTVDGVPALDPDLLAAEITELTDACDTALDGADAEPFTRPGSLTWFDRPPGFRYTGGLEPLDAGSAADQGRTADQSERLPASPPGRAPNRGTARDDDHGPSESPSHTPDQETARDDDHGPSESPSHTPDRGTARDDIRGLSETSDRADDYALAAGGSTPTDGGLIVARGSGEWDWRRCPPGILDAGENAVSWQVTRTAEISTVRVSVVAAPDCRRVVPEHLRPSVRVRSAQSAPTDQAGATPSADVEFTAPLHLRGDAWTGVVQVPGPPETSPEITIFVPNVGPADSPHEESDIRARIRRFARLRLSEHTGDSLLTAEAAAAATDEDF
ncbi:hypothetical protein [Nocardia sp. NPDC060259]|uniref:hypothetical protein n=1 Tax=Nocardia sp. NPDC060259 TaxID=3347088 RepID=UPI00365F2ABF